MQTHATIDQPVIMTDVVALQTGLKLTGEHDYNNPYDEKDNHLSRIKDHIELLATIANRQHQKENFSQNANGIWTMKPRHKNHVTRLLMHEFSLYTRIPLSITEFDTLCDNIKQLAAQLSDNLYLLISSVAVVENKILYNYAIHVQCGKDPQIDRTAKINPADLDPIYPYAIQYFFAKGRDTNVIKCKTIGGVEFITIIDICRDHLKGEGKKSFYSNVRMIKKADPHAIIRCQVSHIVTSETVEFHPEHAVGPFIVKVDPIVDPNPEHRKHSNKAKDAPVKLSADLAKDIPERLKEEYCQTTLEYKKTEIQINTPPFGPRVGIQAFSAYQLPLFSLDTQKITDKLESKIASIHSRSSVIQSGDQTTQNLSSAKEQALTILENMLNDATDEASILRIIQEWKSKKLKDISPHPIANITDSENLSLYSIACMRRSGFWGRTGSQKIIDNYVKSLAVTPTKIPKTSP